MDEIKRKDAIWHTIISAKILQNKINNYLNREIMKTDVKITAPQADILLYLYMRMGEEVNPIDIQNFYSLSRPTVLGLLKRLHEKGYVEYRESKKNKKYKAVVLSEKIIKVQEQLVDCILEGCDMITKGISQEELKIFGDVIVKVLHNVN